jgi:DNA-binding LacI/PurR family transcriptional regulator
MTAIGLIHAARESGISLPDDLAIVGFDDIAFARFAHPSLTTVAQPIAKLGQEAMQMVLVLRSQETERELPSTNVKVPGRLIVRASSG